MLMKKSKLISAGELITLVVLALIVFGFGFADLSLTGYAVSKTNLSVAVFHAPGNPAIGKVVTISALASGDKGTRVRIYVDNLLRKTCSVSGYVNCSYSAKYQAGNHTYYALAIDRFVNRARDPIDGSKTFYVRFVNDTEPPKLRVYTSPFGEIFFADKKLDLIAAASDNFGLSSISLYLNGANVNTCPASGRSDNCRYSFRPKKGNYTYSASAIDMSGNTAGDPASGSREIVVK